MCERCSSVYFLLDIKLKLLGGVFFPSVIQSKLEIWLVFMILEFQDFFNDVLLTNLGLKELRRKPKCRVFYFIVEVVES